MTDDLPTLHFESGEAMRGWLESNHMTSRGPWLGIFRKGSSIETVSFQEVLEAGLA